MKRIGILALLFAVCITGCDDDDKLPKAASTTDTETDLTNTNRNNTTTDPTLGRLEFPHLREDATTQLLIRRVENYGVNYAIEYDLQKRSQRWTCWQWYRGNSGKSWNRKNWDTATDNEWAMLNLRTHGWGDPFQPDPDLAPQYRTELADYNGIPYQRGHICASADRLNSRDANEQTFYLSNIMPQEKALNEGIWLDMENQVQAWGRDDDFRDVLYVVKGGTIDDANIRTWTSTGMPVPKYFYMALLREYGQGNYQALAFCVEHTSKRESGTPLRNYVMSIDALEALTGIDFFCNLPDEVEDEVESASAATIISDWGL